MERKSPKPTSDASTSPVRLTIEALADKKIFETTRLRQPRWMRDGRRFSYLDRAPDADVTTVWIFDTDTGKRSAVLTAANLQRSGPNPPEKAAPAEDDDEPDEAGKPDTLAILGYRWSPDETRILFARPPAAHASPVGDEALYMYTLETHALKRITHLDQRQRNPKWSPDGSRIGYVRGDDLYVLDLSTENETRLTDSATTTVYNGRFGWIYEEELGLVDGWAWSPDGKHIAYCQTDEGAVPLVAIPTFADAHFRPTLQRYPKAGDPNPRVRIGVLDLEARHGGTKPNVPQTRWLELNLDAETLITRLQWTPKGGLLIQAMPRIQNRIDVLHVDVTKYSVTEVFHEEDPQWLDPRGEVKFIGDGDEFLWLSDRDGFTHLHLYDLQAKLRRQVTRGDWDVDEICGIDATHRLVYFTAARPSATERQIFSALLDGGGDCVRLTEEPGTHTALFSFDTQHYLDTYSSRSQAPRVRLHHASGRHLADIHDNPQAGLAGHPLGEWEFLTFRTAGGVELNASMLRPADFNPKRRYPVLMYTYNGPGSQIVLDSYGNGGGLEQFLGQRGILSVCVDGRGTGGRGRAFQKAVHGKLGVCELEDQLEGARWLATLPYVDRKRIGIWGWSFGGYLASLCLLRGKSVFKSAIAVAPVTDWSLYDTIYTERYMGLPATNPNGYTVSAPVTYAEDLQGSLLLIHGTADDNVHFQNSARLAAALQAAGKQFQTMYYPDKHHGLEGVSKHLYAMIEEFLVKNL